MYDFLNADKYGHFVTFRKYFRRWVEKRKKLTTTYLHTIIIFETKKKRSILRKMKMVAGVCVHDSRKNENGKILTE